MPFLFSNICWYCFGCLSCRVSDSERFHRLGHGWLHLSHHYHLHFNNSSCPDHSAQFEFNSKNQHQNQEVKHRHWRNCVTVQTSSSQFRPHAKQKSEKLSSTGAKTLKFSDFGFFFRHYKDSSIIPHSSTGILDDDIAHKLYLFQHTNSSTKQI